MGVLGVPQVGGNCNIYQIVQTPMTDKHSNIQFVIVSFYGVGGLSTLCRMVRF